MNKAADDLISRKQAIKEVLALCPKEIKPNSLDEYGATLLYGIVDVILKQLPAVDAVPATIEPKRIELADETKAWLDQMDAVDALGNIADICIDWDGYRTADGLGGLINEIWAYARYCADKLLKAQEPVEPIVDIGTQKCGNCGHTLEHQQLLGDNVLFHEQYNYCPECGKRVKWE